MMTLVLEIIEWKIKGKDVLAGLVKWENKVAELQRDHNGKLGENIQRAMLIYIYIYIYIYPTKCDAVQGP